MRADPKPSSARPRKSRRACRMKESQRRERRGQERRRLRSANAGARDDHRQRADRPCLDPGRERSGAVPGRRENGERHGQVQVFTRVGHIAVAGEEIVEMPRAYSQKMSVAPGPVFRAAQHARCEKAVAVMHHDGRPGAGARRRDSRPSEAATSAVPSSAVIRASSSRHDKSRSTDPGQPDEGLLERRVERWSLAAKMLRLLSVMAHPWDEQSASPRPGQARPAWPLPARQGPAAPVPSTTCRRAGSGRAAVNAGIGQGATPAPGREDRTQAPINPPAMARSRRNRGHLLPPRRGAGSTDAMTLQSARPLSRVVTSISP